MNDFFCVRIHFSSIVKERFVGKVNNCSEEEPFVQCVDCNRKHHQVCVLYFEEMWSYGFQCKECAKPPKRINSNSLPKCSMSEYIEAVANDFLKTKKDGLAVNIRVLSNEDRISEIKPEMQRHLIQAGKTLPNFPYRAKSIFAFQEVDGTDLCFFGLYVQEYGSECCEPNARRINIAYLDTVKLFDPGNLRSALYHKIILAYLDYCRKQGFVSAHIWVSPPAEGSEYVFYAHPPDQRTLTHDLLLKWYISMLEKGKKEGIIHDFNNLYQEILKKERFCFTSDIPYFEGDFWPHVIEKQITRTSEKKKPIDSNKQILSVMKKLQDSFIVVHLVSAQAVDQLDVSVYNCILLFRDI